MGALLTALARSHSRRHAFLLFAASTVVAGLLAPDHAAGSAYPLRFAPVQEYPLMDTDAESVAIGDVTGDHRKDVVLSTGSWSNPQNQWKVMVYRQRADGSLAEPERFSPVWKVAVQSVAIGDLDGDGRNDVVVRGGTWVRIAWNRRRGFNVSVALRSRQSEVEVGDVTGDG